MKNQGNTVLIVEDTRSLAEALKHQITHELGLECLHAVSLTEASSIIDAHADEIFIALLDLNLPDAPNGEIVDHVLSKSIPSIVLTGTYNDDIRDSMMARPLVDYVVKRNMNELLYVCTLVKRIHNNRNIKVLIVDDSQTQRQLMKALLDAHCFHVLEAIDGIDALEKITEHPDIRLILTDYNMPNMDGLELITKLREKYTRNELAIIGMSADNSKKVTIDQLKAGANDFITRPFINEELYCRINQNIEAIENFTKLLDSATKDFLTGLYNRKYVFETGNKLFQNARRKNISLTTAMLDIDFFKKINDTHGHHIGDLALKHISGILTEQLRDADVVARMGGEEFCVLCINIDDENSEKLFERIRVAIQNNPLITDDLTVPMTVSIGYSMQLTDNLDSMINNADAALYKAKETGRNKVVRFD